MVDINNTYDKFKPQFKELAKKIFGEDVNVFISKDNMLRLSSKNEQFGAIDLDKGTLYVNEIDLFSGKDASKDLAKLQEYKKQLTLRNLTKLNRIDRLKGQNYSLFGLGKLDINPHLVNRFNKLVKLASINRNIQALEKLKIVGNLLEVNFINIQEQQIKSKLKIEFGKDTTINANDSILKARFAIVELKDLIQSHDPDTFSKNPYYPADCQTRDYSESYEQSKVIINTDKFDARYLINDVPNGAEGTPITDNNLVVFGGNSRSMSLKRLSKKKDIYYTKYVNYLNHSICLYGFPADISRKFDYPVLIRVLKDEVKSCEWLSRALQNNQSQEQDDTNFYLALSKQLSKDEVISLAQILALNEIETVAEIFNNRENERNIVSLLERAKIITPTNQSKFLDSTGRVSQSGKLVFTNMLLAIVLDDKELFQEVASFKNMLLAALPSILMLNYSKGKYNIIPNIREVVRLEHKRRLANMPLEVYLNQTSITGGTIFITQLTKLVWLSLASEEQNMFKQFMKRYQFSASQSANGDSMFDNSAPKPEEMFYLFLAQVKEYKEQKRKKALGLNDYNINNLNDCLISPTLDNSQSLLSDLTLEMPNEIYLPEEDLDALPPLESTRDVIYKRYSSKPLNLERTADLFPGLLDNAKILVKGKQGTGKSTLALLLMKELAKSGNVLFVCTEEKAGERLKNRLIANRITTNNIKILNTRDFQIIKDYINSGEFKFIFIDSHNKIEAQQKNIINYVMSKPDLFMCIISRLDKTGKVLGSSDWEYDLDTVVIFPEHGIAFTDKHRDGEAHKEMRVLKSRAWYMDK